jgi:hypothetical protein
MSTINTVQNTTVFPVKRIANKNPIVPANSTSREFSIYYLFKKQEIINGGPWNMQQGNYTDAWTENPHNPQTHSVFASKISKQLWQEKTKYYES